MMINKRLIGAVPESKKYIAGNVALQWCSLCANIAMMSAVTELFAALFAGSMTQSKIVTTAVIALAAVAVRYGCTVGASRMGYLSSKAVKKTLRGAIYDKLLCLGASYSEQVKTSEVVQVAVEGVDQLETYFGAYLPQFFYAMLAPLTLFVVLCFVSVPAALGVIMAATQLRAGKIDLAGALLIILLAADFFIPMRQLGSFFHIAMNGMAASDKIFRLLDLSEPAHGGVSCPAGDIVCRGLRFSYEPEREILHGVDLTIPQGKFVSLVGESGCGKSTISALLMGRNKGYTGSMTVGGAELRDIEEASLMRRITYVSHQSNLFKGTVRDNLLMGKPGASDDELWRALTQVNLADFLRGEAGLDTLLSERGENLSGGQRQRLALARALLHDSPVYIFDEATSNIDVESENDIMAQIHALAGRKTVLLISHRLANVTASDEIYVLERGNIVQHGTHDALLKQGGAYAALWSAQQALEHYGEEAAK